MLSLTRCRIGAVCLCIGLALGHDMYGELNNRPAASSAKNNGDPENIIEIFVWSAPDVFRFHRQRLPDLSAKAVESEFLRVWELSIIKDVDLIFRSMTNTSLKLYYVGGGNDRDLKITWYADNVQGDLMRRQAQEDVTVYLKGQVNVDILPQYDHAVVLTRQDVVDTFEGRGADKIAYGTQNSICKDDDPKGASVSLAEVSSPFFIKAVAQSIIFAFGVSYYFMGDPYSVMNREVAVDVPFSARASRWTIDPVTDTRIQAKIDELDAAGQNCLRESGTGFTDAEYEAFVNAPTYGREFSSLTDQCEIFAGAGSDICLLDQTTQCYNGVRCSDPDNSFDCTLDYFLADATPCGGDEGCRFGDCVSNAIIDGRTTTPIPTTTTLPPIPDCCCELRDIGTVNINMVYEPCDP